MNTRTFTRLILAILLAFLAYVPVTYAATATTNFNVTAGVAGTCTITMKGDLNFGQYTGAAITGVTTDVQLTCTSGDPYTVAMGYGRNPTTGNIRQMKNGSNILQYELGKNLDCSNPWGNSGTLVRNGTGTGAVQSFRVYGCMAGGQAGVTGMYSDQVTVTVNF